MLRVVRSIRRPRLQYEIGGCIYYRFTSNAHRKQHHAAGKHGLLRGLDEMQKETSTRDYLHGRSAWLRQDLGIVSIIQSC